MFKYSFYYEEKMKICLTEDFTHKIPLSKKKPLKFQFSAVLESSLGQQQFLYALVNRKKRSSGGFG